MRGIVLGAVAAVAMLGCIDFGGKLDTPIEGGGTLAGGGGALGGGDGGVTGNYSCDHHAVDSTCSSFASGTSQTDAQAACNAMLLTTPCPTTAEVGRCTSANTIIVYYSDGTTPHTAADAKANCDLVGGAFTK